MYTYHELIKQFTRLGINGVRLTQHTSQASLVTYFFILLYQTVFGRKRSEMVSKKSSGRFYFWGITSRGQSVCLTYCVAWGIIHSSTEDKLYFPSWLSILTDKHVPYRGKVCTHCLQLVALYKLLFLGHLKHVKAWLKANLHKIRKTVITLPGLGIIIAELAA